MISAVPVSAIRNAEAVKFIARPVELYPRSNYVLMYDCPSEKTICWLYLH